jgi:CMP-N-acetylneuraminic acid synthetase
VIPARSGSKSISDKNLSIIGGKPLIVRSLEFALRLDSSQKPILSSESWEYAEIAQTYLSGKAQGRRLSPTNSSGNMYDSGQFEFHHRSLEAASDSATIPEVLSEISKSLEVAGQVQPDAWLVLQPTSPFRSEEDVQIWSHEMQKAGKAASAVSVTKIDDMHPARMYYLDDENLRPGGFFPGYEASRRQDLPELYIRDGGFYLIGSSLAESGLQFSSSPRAIVRTFPWSLNIDGPADLLLAKSVTLEEI